MSSHYKSFAREMSKLVAMFLGCLLLGVVHAKAQAPEPDSAAIEGRARAMLHQLPLATEVVLR